MPTEKKKVKYWFPWSPPAFREDTMHLTHVQRGLYRDLIDYYMESKKPLPDNDMALANICRVDLSTWLANSVEIRAMFMKTMDEKAIAKLSQSRCDANLAEEAARREKYSKNGKKGGRGKALKGNDNKAIAKPQASTKDKVHTTVSEEERILSNPKNPLKPPLPPTPQDAGGLKPSVSGSGAAARSVQNFDIERLISDKTRERAKLAFRAMNRDFYAHVQIYNAGVREGKRPPPDNPDGAFLNWIPAYTKGKKL